MAGKRSVAEVALKSTGGAQVQKTLDGVGKATDRVGRQQTRLGQASAAAGRQFSAQASGLGGLVAAYAGAAATVFAITAAFQALNAAARAEQTITGVNALANAIGESGPQIIAGLQEITKGQLSIVQTAELANLALSSGFSADQINNLAEISLKASRALGRDLTDSFNRLVRGVTKLEPELLDELGIFTRIEPAAERFAAQVGKVASQLSNFEKRQAFANAVAEEGTEKFKDIDTSADTTSESLEKLSATVANLGQQVGAFVAKVLQPLADAISGNLIASIGAFGILAKTVFGTTIREATSSIENFNNQIEGRSIAIIDKLGASSKKVAQANDSLGQSLSKVNLRVRAVTGANEQEFKSLIQLGRARELSQAQTLRLNQIIDQEIKKVQTAQKALTNTTMTQKQLTAETTRLTNRLQQLQTAQSGVNKRLEATPKVATAAATAFKGLALAIGTVTTGFLKVFGAITTFVTVVSILTTVGSIVLDAFGFLDPLIERLEKLTRQVKVLLDITGEAKGQQKAGEGLVEGILGLSENATVGLDTVDQILQTALGGKNIQKTIIEAIKENQSPGDVDAFIDALIPGDLENTRVGDRIKELLKDALGEDVIKEFANITAGSLQGLDVFAEATGRTAKTTRRQLEVLTDGSLQFKKAAELGLKAITEKGAAFIDSSKLEDEELKRAETLNKLEVSRLQSQEISANLQEALNSGLATAEQIEKRRGAIQAKIANLNKEILKFQKMETELGDEAAKRAEEIRDLLIKQLEVINHQADSQLAILRTRDQIRKTFQSEIAAASKVSGFFTLQGEAGKEILKINDFTSQQENARVQLLAQALKIGKQDLENRKAGLPVVGDAAQRAQLAADAQKALTGQFLKSLDAAVKLGNQLEKIKTTEDNRRVILEKTLDLEKIKARITAGSQAVAAKNAELNREKSLLDLASKRLKLAKDQAKIGTERRGMAVDRSLASGLITEEQARVFKLSLAQEDLEELRKFTKEEEENIRKRAELERQRQSAIISEQQSLLGATFENSAIEGLIDKRTKEEKDAANKRIEAAKLEKINNIDLLQAERGILIEQIQAFADHTSSLAEVLAGDITARRELLASQEGRSFAGEVEERLRSDPAAMAAASAAIPGLDAALAQGLSVSDARRASLAADTSAADAQVQKQAADAIANLDKFDFETVKNSIIAAAEAEKKLSDFRIDQKSTAETAAAEIKLADARAKLKNITAETGISIETLQLELAKGEDSFNNFLKTVATANHTMLQLKMGVRDALVDGLGSSLDLLFQNIADGKPVLEGMQEQLRGVFENVRKQVLEKTLVKPLQDKLTSSLNNMFGINEKGADNAEVVNGALKTLSVNESGTNFVTDLKEKGNDAFDTILGRVGEFKDKLGEGITSLADKFGSLLSSVFQGASNMLGGLFGGKSGGGGGLGSFISSIFGGGGSSGGGLFSGNMVPGGMASGGFVPFSAYQRLAAGGQARDRVPALLEPGEFVMKRSAANSIGGPALNQMNATGSMGGNVVVNIENKGTPQEATASEPRFDGEKFVVDIITRDLRNNGPVRKALRGGGA